MSIDRIGLRSRELSRLRLNESAHLRVDVPSYERRVTKRICHIGVGGFHRSHQAFYVHRLLQSGLAEGWGICGIGLRPADRAILEALRLQDGLYSLWELEGDAKSVTIVGSIMEFLDASLDGQAAVTILSEAETRIVSMTVTEGGYCLKDGALDAHHPDVLHDLEHPARPRSLPGLLVAASVARRDAGTGGFTALSCDNLLGNGDALRQAVVGFAKLIDEDLAKWVSSNLSFPCSMVDRITPVTTPERREALCVALGVTDQIPVICEPWMQWVCEDHFVTGRPPFEEVGVQFSGKVSSYEEMKVGLLNGGHSAISHLGLMLGYDQVHQALADPAVRRWHKGYMAAVAATLQPVSGLDYNGYQEALARRFANEAIQDRLLRLAMDSSIKFPQVLLPPVLRSLQWDFPLDHLATAIALWIEYLSRLARDAGRFEEYVDHDKEALVGLAAAAAESGIADSFMTSKLPLPAECSRRFSESVNCQLSSIRERGLTGHLELLSA